MKTLTIEQTCEETSAVVREAAQVICDTWHTVQPSQRQQDVHAPAQIPSACTEHGPLDDEALMLGICHGAQWAMEEFYQRYSRYAYALAYRIVNDSIAAEDIMQDAFLAVWRKAASYQRQHGSARSWLQGIVHHRAVDVMRSREHQCISLQIEHEQVTTCKGLDVWEEVWHKEQHAIISHVMGQLPVAQREMIELGYFGGYTHVEIAERCQLPLGTVKGRMRLGLQKMKQLLCACEMEAA